jgi:hypothetical protein
MQETFDRTQTGGDTLARDETFDLISSEKVDGTAVYNREVGEPQYLKGEAAFGPPRLY